jgi:hypothetical protein
MSADRRAELQRLESRAGLNPAELNAAESTMADTLLVLILGAVGAFLVSFSYVLLNRRGILNTPDDLVEEKASFQALDKSQGFNLSNMELVQQALIVMRHTSTRTLHRVLDMVGQTSRQTKKDDPDIEMEATEIDILQLNNQQKPIPDAQWIMDDMSDECSADPILPSKQATSTLTDLETLKLQCQQMSTEHISKPPMVFDSVEKPAISEEPPTSVPVAVDEPIQSEDCAVTAVSKAGINELEPIDQLLSKTTALL